jgi:hypothetical protein
MRVRHIPQLAAVVAAALVAAGTAQAATPRTGFYGIVLRGPTKPVCEVDMSCEAPAPGVTLVFSRAGRIAGLVTTGRDGTFRIPLVPGTYVVRSTRKFLGGGITPTLVAARPGRLLRVVFHVDTGIR